jgi:glycosyltransferase involved in cell wall biosynthesis
MYGSQLSLCVIATGRNNEFSISKMYDSIQRQNYSNYKIIHIDDNSTDDTIANTLKYYQNNEKIK